MSNQQIRSAEETLRLARQARVIPDVLADDLTHDLKSAFLVAYPNDVIVSVDSRVDREAVQAEPDLVFPEADAKARYTLLMVDPDLTHTNDQTSGQVAHHIRSGIQFDEASHKGGNSDQTSPNDVSYVGPAPPLGSGAHRYVFILCREPESYDRLSSQLRVGKTKEDLAARIRFDATEYVRGEGLKVEALAWMLVDPTLKSTADNVMLMASSAGTQAHRIIK